MNQGRVTLVSGAARGMGLSQCRAMVAEGAQVVHCPRRFATRKAPRSLRSSEAYEFENRQRTVDINLTGTFLDMQACAQVRGHAGAKAVMPARSAMASVKCGGADTTQLPLPTRNVA